MSTRPLECGSCGLDHPSSEDCAELAPGEHEYILTTVCQGTITETWRLVSTRTFTVAELDELLCGQLPCPDDVTLACIVEETSDEENRELRDVTQDGETLLSSGI